VDEATAREIVAGLRALLPRLATGADSTSAFLQLIDAHVLSGDAGAACGALHAAKAASSTQRSLVQQYTDRLKC
jgi:hypothetical protein